MMTAKVFRTGRSQAVRLPKEFRFKSREVAINKVNGVVVLFPLAKGWDVLDRALSAFTKDYLSDRRQPRRAQRRRTI